METKSAFLLLSSVAVVSFLSVRMPALAAPEIILFHGSALSKPIITTGWEHNAVLMEAVTQVTSVSEDALKNRPFIDVAMFWGPDWYQYLVARKPVDVLKPEQANQHARIYPATATAPALFVFDDHGPFGQSVIRTGRARAITANGLAMLKKVGVLTAPLTLERFQPVR